jgi:putative tricarboxylic transport membrane protein
VRVLAIAADKRLEGVFAQSPTWKEQGIDYVSDSFQGVMTAPGASTAQQAYWVNALRKVSETGHERAEAILTELGLLQPSASRIAQAR